MRKFLFFFAIIGWTISLIIHFTAALGDYDLSRQIPFIWLLHVGIFVVWLPTVFILKNNPDLQELKKTALLDFATQIKYFKVFFSQTPTWLTVIAVAGFFYAIINFMFFMTSQPGTPEIRDGQYILQSHGHLVKTVTESEYNHYLANQTRGFSGHWIAFYGLAAAILFPLKISKQEK